MPRISMHLFVFPTPPPLANSQTSLIGVWVSRFHCKVFSPSFNLRYSITYPAVAVFFLSLILPLELFTHYLGFNRQCQRRLEPFGLTFFMTAQWRSVTPWWHGTSGSHPSHGGGACIILLLPLTTICQLPHIRLPGCGFAGTPDSGWLRIKFQASRWHSGAREMAAFWAVWPNANCISSM
jgi:hypothetical protein